MHTKTVLENMDHQASFPDKISALFTLSQMGGITALKLHSQRISYVM